jgi:hypothetical protein
MDPNLDPIVVEDIVIQDRAPEAPSFDTAILIGYHTAWLDDLVRDYSDPAEMLADGFLVTSALYLMAQAFKAIDGAPSTFKIGRLQSVPTQIVELTPTSAAQGFVYKGGLVGGLSWTYTVPGSATIASVCTAIASLITALSAGTTAVGSSGTKIVCTATAPGAIVSFYPGKGIKMLDVTADAGFAADIAAIAGEDNDWYCMVTTMQSRVYNKAAALYAQANKKIFLPMSADWNLADATVTSGDVGSELLALSYTRMWGLWHRYIGGTEWGNAAWAAKTLSYEPGNATAALKTLTGISADVLTAGEQSGITAKKWSRYTVQGGTAVTFESYTPGGRFIDVTRFVDWLDITIKLDVYAVLINNPKVAYTNAGISMIKGAILGALKKGQTAPNDGLTADEDPIVTIAAVKGQSTSDRAQRRLKQIKWSARLSGAFHGVAISGTLSV